MLIGTNHWSMQQLLYKALSITTMCYKENLCKTQLYLTHWGWVTEICCVIKLIIIGSDNGLSPDRCQVIIWTNAGILLIGPFGTNFSEILIEILTFQFKKMHFKVLLAKLGPFCLGLNLLNTTSHWWNRYSSFKSWLETLELQQSKRFAHSLHTNNGAICKTPQQAFLGQWDSSVIAGTSLSEVMSQMGTDSHRGAARNSNQAPGNGVSQDKMMVSGQEDLPDSKVHEANMGPIWGRQGPGGPHVGPMNFAIWARLFRKLDVLQLHLYLVEIQKEPSPNFSNSSLA